MKIAKTVIAALFGLFMANSGLNKFTKHMPMPEMSEEQMELFGHFMALEWLLPLAGIAEIVGGILIIIPKFRALGALIMLPVSVGIFLYHLVSDPSGFVIGAVLLVLNLLFVADSWGKYKHIWA